MILRLVKRPLGGSAYASAACAASAGSDGVLCVDLGVGHPSGEAVADDAHGHPRPAEPRLPMHDRWVGDDEVEQVVRIRAMSHRTSTSLLVRTG